MPTLIADVKHALRTLRNAPVFTASVVLTCALGTGGTTAIFTLIDSVMLRRLPVSDPAHLYRIGDGDDTIAEGRHGRWGFFSFPLYQQLKAEAREFEEITAFGLASSLSVRRQGTGDAAYALRAEYVTGNYFSTLGVRPHAGRAFVPDDDRLSAPPVAVLNHQAWREIYGADPSVVGATLVVQGHPFTVIGVAAPGFFGESVRANPPDIWLPLQQEPAIAGGGSLLSQPTASWLAVIGRLRRDASTDAVAARLTGVLRRWIRYGAGYPADRMAEIIRELPNQTIAIVPAGAGIGFGGISVKEQFGPSLQILFAICALVLVIACANIANLLLAHSARRRRQTAVRLAVGATRRHIVTQSLTESVLLATGGGLAGLVVAAAVARLLVALAFRTSQSVPIVTTPSLSVLAFAAGSSLLTGIVFGAVPAWSMTRTDPIDALRGSGRGPGPQSAGARTALLIVQATVSVVLVACATMLARSLENLERQDFGYRLDRRVIIGLNRLPSAYTSQQLSNLYRNMEQRLASLPGVHGCGLATYNPLTGVLRDTVLVAGHPGNPGNNSLTVWDRVSADYLQTLGVGLVRGRLFTSADNESASPVAVVNEAFVRRFFKDIDDPLDQRFGVDRPKNATFFRIVGVVHDAKFRMSGLNEPTDPMFFVPLAQRANSDADQVTLLDTLSHFVQGIVLVTDSPPGRLEPIVRRTLTEADPNLTVTSVRTIQDQVDLLFNRERAVARLAAGFGLVALVLAAVGVYGVTACTVAQQTHEIGIRVALGADDARVIRLVLGRTFRHVSAGIIVGVPCAAGAARLMTAQLYGVSSWDPFALAVAGGALAMSAFVAAIVPSVRAASISPVNALRVE